MLTSAERMRFTREIKDAGAPLKVGAEFWDYQSKFRCAVYGSDNKVIFKLERVEIEQLKEESFYIDILSEIRLAVREHLALIIHG